MHLQGTRNLLMTALRFSLSLAAGLMLLAGASAEEARGLILKIDPDKKELRLEGRGPWRGDVLDLTVGPKTHIFIGGQPAELSDLAPGWRIRVVYERRDGKAVAQVIRSFGLLGLVRPRSQPQADLPMPRKAGDGVSGTLQRVALTDREIVVIGPGAKGPKTETTIAVPEGTPVTRDGKAIAFDALKEGETVTVKTEQRKGRLTALSIQAGQGAAAAPAMPPRRDIIPRLRLMLKLADELLRQMEQRQGAPNRP
jgi:Cu/Ag efflux protein CusF